MCRKNSPGGSADPGCTGHVGISRRYRASERGTSSSIVGRKLAKDVTDLAPNPYAKRLGTAGRAAVLERFLCSEHSVRIDDGLADDFRDEATVNATLRLALQMKRLLARPKRAARPSRKKPT